MFKVTFAGTHPAVRTLATEDQMTARMAAYSVCLGHAQHPDVTVCEDSTPLATYVFDYRTGRVSHQPYSRTRNLLTTWGAQ